MTPLSFISYNRMTDDRFVGHTSLSMCVLLIAYSLCVCVYLYIPGAKVTSADPFFAASFMDVAARACPVLVLAPSAVSISADMLLYSQSVGHYWRSEMPRESCANVVLPGVSATLMH